MTTRLFLLLLCALLSSAIARASAADAPGLNDANAVEQGREALASSGKYPWYNRREDTVRRLNTVPRPSADSRGEKWLGKSKTGSAATPLRRANLFGSALQWIGLTALVLLLGLLAFLVATAFLKDEVSDTVAVRRVVESRHDADRVEALPFHLRAATGDFLAEARRLYEAGNYSDAIIYLFSYTLVELDRQHVIRLAKGKTNRQYLREARQRPALAALLEPTMIAFEDAFFGRKALSREAFERLWQRLDEFHSHLERLERTAA